ncbi:ferritin heavy chain-like isoform X4 [Canis lupus familiaris]|uniref:ferritin heavy chain-like isoform X4 n=1 Tax=Canis lupus familiaris TaxID=9615 RepID=UPI00022572CF|nr:ferritin heavy chain-like isoform X4 [Canis lupus familiaris]
MTTVLDLEKNRLRVEQEEKGLGSVGWGSLRQSRRGFLLQQCSDGRGAGAGARLPSGAAARSRPGHLHLHAALSPLPPRQDAAPAQVRQKHRRASVELYASCVSLSVSYRLDRDDVALKNLAEYFLHQSHEEREHAEKLMKLQNQRGGRTFLQDIKKPDRDDWENGLNSMECALHLEKSVNQSPLELHKLATDKNDPHLCDFIETHYLNEQVKSIKELGDHVTSLRKMGAPESGMAEYLFDKHALGNSDSES